MLKALLTLLLLAAAGSVSAATRYVWQSSPSPAPPYATWATAAHVIQDAVDAALTGDEVVVTNGTYVTGGRVVGTDLLVNRVAVDKPLTLRSVNGPEFTVIRGVKSPTGFRGCGDGAIRCVFLTNGVTLSGFTLTNGATRSAVDRLRDGQGGGLWCESTNAVVSNCVLAGNSAGAGGGASWGTLNNCTLTGNSADVGGGAYYSTLYNCVLSGNSANVGGGAYSAEVSNCTLTGNSAYYGGGAHGGTLNNCIIYYNTAPVGANYHEYSSLDYCCTTPLPGRGLGNLSLDPQLASASHLSASSPCRGAGNPAYATGTDIDGEAWGSPPSIGCDEYHAGAITGPLCVGIAATFTNVAVGFPVKLTALIDGRTTAGVWEFGDGLVASNRPYAAHTWTMPGNYAVVLRAYNESQPGGVGATVTIHVVTQPVHFVAADTTNPLPPYTSWATAARNIQDAVDVASVPGALVLVTNGTYGAGGRDGNRVAVDRPLILRSVNGPELTLVTGSGTTRCVYLTNAASLSGFTLTNGVAGNGGGIWCESVTAVVSNCVVAGNSASSGGGGVCSGTLNNCSLMNNSSPEGGGAFDSTLNNCTLTGNSASSYGGGALLSRLDHCTLMANSAREGGGAYSSRLNSCTLTGNSAQEGGGGVCDGPTIDESILNNCTLTGNSAYYGGGASGGTLNNCSLTSNSAIFHGGGAYGGALNNCELTHNSAAYGGGDSGSTLNNCILVRNSATNFGGGTYGGALNNCTLIANSAESGGGAAAGFIGTRGMLNNCILYFNVAAIGSNYFDFSEDAMTLNYSCTTPAPTNGVGNITNAPLFVDYPGGNLRLQSTSPCINAGRNAHALGPTDLDGLPRIVTGTVDLGAYEFQGPGSVISYAWLQQYILPTDGSEDATDPDADGHNTWQEWRCLTDPTNAVSALRLLSASPAGTNVTVSWQSVAGVNYFLERSTDLSANPCFTLLATGIPGEPGNTTFTDTNAAGASPLFYRVGVRQ